MIHLLDKLSSQQLYLLLILLIIAGSIAICSIFRSIAHMIRGWPQKQPEVTRSEFSLEDDPMMERTEDGSSVR